MSEPAPTPSATTNERPMWQRALLAFGGTTFLFLAIGMLLPKTYDVSRTREIAVPVSDVFPAVADLRQFAQWNPWVLNDPDMTVSFGEESSGMGATYAWESPQHGAGSMTITDLVPDSSIVTNLDFGEQAGAEGRWAFEPVNEQVTRVTWGMKGDLGANPLMGWMALMMDSMAGKDFEVGLELLAKHVEQ